MIDESHKHLGHLHFEGKERPSQKETHFKVTIVSAAFVGLNRVKRQQLVYALIAPFFKLGLHAFSQVTLTPEEWSTEKL